MANESRESVLYPGLASSLVATLLATMFYASPAEAAAGRTAGSFNVSNTGAAIYAIPLFTPPGPRGMQPSVALTYNSNGGVGYVGMGWSISGLSAISRCRLNIAWPSNLYALSPYCLDGNHLMRQSGTYGIAGSVWATEIADFSHISVSDTQTISSVARGPSTWSVKRRDGTTWTYGGTADSRVAGIDGVFTSWLVSEIKDRSGNKIKFTYETPDSTTSGTTHPIKIEWTQTYASSGTYLYSMEFIYGSNALASSYSGYDAGAAVRDIDLLDTILVKQSTTTLRKYLLNYETSPTTGAKRLDKVTECDGGGTPDCLAFTDIDYQNGEAGIQSTPTLTLPTSYWPSGEYDFDGDNLKDLTYYRDGLWYVRIASPSGYGSEISTGINEFVTIAGDPFGNGRDIILGRDYSSGDWYAHRWNGSSFSSESLGISDPGWLTFRDVDGDGRDDLLYVVDPVAPPYPLNPTMDFVVMLSTSTGSTLSFDSPSVSPYVPSIFSCCATLFEYGWISESPFDANGDGRNDLLVYGMFFYWDDYYGWYEVPFNSVLTAGSYGAVFDEYITSSIYAFNPANLNSDLCADMSALNEVLRSDCAGGGSSSSTTGSVIGFIDWNGDGRKDVLESIGGTIYVQISTGEGLATAQSTGLSGCWAYVTDADGDGLDDLICDASPEISVYLHAAATVKPDLAVSFTDGYGVNQTVSYAVSTHEGYTPCPGYSPCTSVSYPRRDVTSPQMLVRTVNATNGDGTGVTNGTGTTTYSYFGATEDVAKGTFQGFEKTESVNSFTGIKRVRQFEQEFPKSGMLKSERFYQPVADGGHLISSKSLAVSSITLDPPNNQLHFPYVSAITEDVYEVGGAKNSDAIIHVESNYTFDTSGNLTVSTRTVTDMDTSSPGYNDSWTTTTSVSITPNTSYWCLGLPTSSEVVYTTTVTGEASVTRRKSFTPDYANCRLDAESVEPLSSALRVDTSYDYDVFGNVNKITVRGRNPNGSDMTDRISETTWGSADGTLGGTGQFPVKFEDALNLNKTTDRTFHPTFGSLLTETDPNGIVVVDNQYDNFGRVTRVDRADGTYTTYDYADCTGACEAGFDRVIIRTRDFAYGGTQIRDSWTHVDLFDRPWIIDSKNFAGSYDRQWRRYDEMGRVAYEGVPCLTSAPCGNAPSGSPVTNASTNTYDLLGRVMTQSRPRSDGDATAVTTTFGYAGRTWTVSDPNGKVTTRILDVNGWMRRSRDHDSYGQNFNYDAAGSLVGVTDTASNTLFSASYYYGAKPFQYSTTDMDLGTWSYTYNSLGELVSWTDAKGQSFSQTYDALSRVITRTDQNTGQNEGTTTWMWGTSDTNHNIGRLESVSMTGSSYSEAHSYDGLGRPSTRGITADGHTYDIDYTYNNMGFLDTLTYPVSTSGTRVKVKYGYASTNGMLQSITDWTSGSAGTVYWAANLRNERGQTKQETLGNSVVTNRSFDIVTGWLNSIQSGVSGGNGLQNQLFAYDKIGNVTQRQDTRPLFGMTENFYYDNLYRLDYSTLDNGSGFFTNLDVTYDTVGMGNITAMTGVGSYDYTTAQSGCSYYSHSQRHAVRSAGGVIYCYDANGNMTSRGGQTINWSSFNYPTYLATATESTTFYYGPDRQYYRQDYNGPSSSETTYYIGGLLEKVCPSTSCSSGTIDWRHYVFAEGQIVAIVSRNSGGTNVVNYLLEDNQGSNSVLIDSSGTNLVRQSYTAYGRPRDGYDWDGAVPSGDLTTIEGITRRGYTGHSMLGRMDLIHMNGRVQDSITGRFLSPDPYVTQPELTQGYNRYAYVNNNPATYTDPSGFAPMLVGYCARTDKLPWKCKWEEADSCSIFWTPECDPYLILQEREAQRLAWELNEAGLRSEREAWLLGLLQQNSQCDYVWIRCVQLKETKPKDVPTTVYSPQGKEGTDWQKLANDWFPGYQVGTCIRGTWTGEKCGLGTWAMGIIGVVPAGKGAKVGSEIGEAGLRAAVRSEAGNLAEQLALGEAREGAGTRIMQGAIMDPRYPEDVWAKMQHVHRNPDGTNIVIHYWQNLESGVREGFKFK